MSDEIKEILDILQKCKDYDDEVYLIKQNGATLLLDYITNLKTIEKEYSPLLSENAELENKTTNLQEETERQSKAQVILDNQIAEMLKYKQRNEKAIEYIKEDMYVEPKELCGLVDGEHLLNILQGKSDE